MYPGGLNQLLAHGDSLPFLTDDPAHIVLFFVFGHPRCAKHEARSGGEGQVGEAPLAVQAEDVGWVGAPIVALAACYGLNLHSCSCIYSHTQTTKMAVYAKSGSLVGAQDEP